MSLTTLMYAAATVVTACAAEAPLRVAFLPFADDVKLKEAWELSVDVPRWFSVTVDTIGSVSDSRIVCVAFDSVLSDVEGSGWTREEYLGPKAAVRLASIRGADYLVSGTVERFEVLKRAVNTDAAVGASHDFTATTAGKGGVTVMGGLQSYTARVSMDLQVYDGGSGSLVDEFELTTEEKDAGFKMWLPFQLDNAEMNYYYMARTPFGSTYFRKSVPGAVMKYFSMKVHRRLRSIDKQHGATDASSANFVEGTVVERSGGDVYVNLGSDDHLLQGELLTVMKPIRPVTSGTDTLGWVEKPAGTLRVRFIKAAHFSVAEVVDERDSIRVDWKVRIGKEEMGDGK